MTDLARAIDQLAQLSPMPATAVAVFTRDEVTAQGVWGIGDLTAAEPATAQHLWDLASLTKGLVTLPEVLALVDQGRIALDAPLRQAWPRVDGRPIGEATLAQVLSYNAGMPASDDFFSASGLTRAERIDKALGTGLERPIGSGAVYSDIGAIAMGELVQDLTGSGLPALAAARTGLRFNPAGGPFIATEECAWRGRLIKGEVHDENAWSFDGVAGHAGAFGTLTQVADAARAWLAGTVVSPRSHHESVTEHSSNESGERFGLGWWLANTRELGGREPGQDGWGLSGFVGNRVWMEPGRGYGVLVLSNRFHPVRGDRAEYNAWCDDLLDTVARHHRG